MAKRPPLLSYENEIRLFALLLILLMMLVNGGTSHLFKSASERLREQEGFLLRTIGEVASVQASGEARSLTTPEARTSLNQRFNEIVLRYHLRRLMMVGRDSLIVSSSELREVGTKEDWFGFSPEETERAWSGMDMISRPYRRGREGYFQKYLVPLPDPITGVAALIEVEKEENYLEYLGRTSRIELIAMATSYGIAILFVSFFIGAILRPYRRMRKAAGDVVPALDADSRDVEFVVKTFEDTIRQLQEKEKILARLHAEAERRAGDLARYNEYILGSIASGVVNCDERGTVTYMNRAAREVLGLSQSPEIGVGKNLETLLDWTNTELLEAFRSALRECEREFSSEVEWAKGGRRHWLGVSSSPLRDSEGRAIGTTFLLNDMTEIKHLQEEMVVKGRLATLGEVSAGIAHEFRNSLGAITGFASLLRKKTQEGDPRREVVEDIVAESNLLDSAVTQFLKFASPEPLNRSAVRLNNLLSDCSQSFAERCRQAGIHLDLRLADEVGEVSLDAAMFKRALMNLLLNALDSMPKGGRLTIETGLEPEGIFLVVKDTGCGIPRGSLERVFTPFFTTKEKGAGMGLAIVQKIVVSHGGRIRLESEEGKGTAVKIHLPSGK